jgi:hypothetical protein
MGFLRQWQQQPHTKARTLFRSRGQNRAHHDLPRFTLLLLALREKPRLVCVTKGPI